MKEAERESRRKRLADIKAGKRPAPECLSSEYRTWMGIIQRCTNINNCNYRHYGGRGISVCARWLSSYSNFLLDMGGKPSPDLGIDRIDNDGDYKPSNCRWATRRCNCRNTRKTRRVPYGGVSLSLSEWAERSGLPYHVIKGRLDRGWTANEAITTRVGKYERRIE